jgi:ribonuclease D
MLITSTAELRSFCETVARHPYVAVDTEFIRERTYWPQLCLVQVAVDGHAAAVDALADGIDLDPLFDLMRNQDVLKIFHSPGQDLSVFHTVMNSVPTPIYDTQTAAMVCGFGEQPAYATLVLELLGERVDKASQLTDWARRPLTDRQIEYAISDVTHLVKVYQMLRDRVEQSERSDWVEQETASLLNPSAYISEPDQQWKRIRIRRPTRKALAVLREVAGWRERVAQSRNRPRAWIIRDDSLAEIAATQPLTAVQLERVRSVTPKLAEGRDGRDILEAVTRAVNLPESDWPELPARNGRNEASDTLVAVLQALLKIRADQNGVATGLVANRKDLELIARDDEADVRALSGWRREVFGEDALRLKRGQLAITSDGSEAIAVCMNGHNKGERIEQEQEPTLN